MTPEELVFAETHEWAHSAEQEGEKIATIGISANAVEALTDLVYMDLPAAGTAKRSCTETRGSAPPRGACVPQAR